MKHLIVRDNAILYVLNGVWAWSIHFRAQEQATEFEEWMADRGYGFTRSKADHTSSKWKTFTYFGEFGDLGSKLQFEWRWLQ